MLLCTLAGPLADLSQSRCPSLYPRWMLIYSGGLAPLTDVLHFTTLVLSCQQRGQRAVEGLL